MDQLTWFCTKLGQVTWICKIVGQITWAVRFAQGQITWYLEFEGQVTWICKAVDQVTWETKREDQITSTSILQRWTRLPGGPDYLVAANSGPDCLVAASWAEGDGLCYTRFGPSYLTARDGGVPHPEGRGRWASDRKVWHAYRGRKGFRG